MSLCSTCNNRVTITKAYPVDHLFGAPTTEKNTSSFCAILREGIDSINIVECNKYVESKC